MFYMFVNSLRHCCGIAVQCIVLYRIGIFYSVFILTYRSLFEVDNVEAHDCEGLFEHLEVTRMRCAGCGVPAPLHT